MIALLIVGTALVTAALVLVAIVKQTSEDNIRDAALLRARDFVALLESGTSPSQLHIRLEEDVFVQVVSDKGEVRAASPPLEGEPPAARMGVDESAIVTDPRGGDDAFLVVEQSVGRPAQNLSVLVGRSIHSVQETVQVVIIILVVAVPLLLAVVGIATWMMVGGALAPVEAIRLEAAAISSTDLHRRAPEPQGDDEIARLARTMNDMLGRLEEARDKQQRLVSDASHELRNPVAAIRQHAETALAHPGETSVTALADDVLPESLRLQRIAEDLLLLARADEHGLELSLRPCDVDDLVLEEAQRLKRTTKMRIDTSGISAARTHGDHLQLQRLVRNLGDNAARYASSTIGLSVRVTDGRVLLQVDDDGPGVPPEHRTTVFERFARLDEARARARGGAGLGLAIVAEIASAHGGRVSVDRGPLGGARFEVALPAAPPDPPFSSASGRDG